MAADLLYKSVLGLCLIISRAAKISAKPGPKQHSLSMCTQQSLWVQQNQMLVVIFYHGLVFMGQG